MTKDCKIQTYKSVKFPCANPIVQEKLKPQSLPILVGDLNVLFNHEDDPIDDQLDKDN